MNITHLFTPEFQGTIHYWWFNSRDFALDDAGASDYLASASVKAYMEDVDALTWIQEEVEKGDGPPDELSFGPDRPGLSMRKTLLRLAEAEMTQAEDPPSVAVKMY